MKNKEQIQKLEQEWLENPRWKGIKRPYSAEDVLKLRGSYKLDYTIAKLMSETLWNKLNKQDFVAGLGALTGNHAVQEAVSYTHLDVYKRQVLFAQVPMEL